MSVAFDMIGKTFGRLTVVAAAPSSKHRELRWECMCACGTLHVVQGKHLRSGAIASCGCFRNEKTSQRFRKHGHKVGGVSATYQSWRGMHERCTLPSHVAYSRYGGRGIRVCERWATFANFVSDMGERPDGMEIDRIDNDGNYEPGNCRWATRQKQMRHLRKLEDHEPNQIAWLLSLGYSKVEIGRFFGVSHQCVRSIARGKQYKGAVTWAA